MIALPAGTHIWVACGVTDMRKGFDTLAMVAQEVVKQSPRSGHVFVFRGAAKDLGLDVSPTLLARADEVIECGSLASRPVFAAGFTTRG